MKNGIRVLRLQKGHKYCVLGRLSPEVGWSYYDTIRVSSCFLSFCFPNISNVYFLQHILIWSHCSFWKTIYLFAIYLLLLLWLCKIYGFWEYGWPPLESCFSLFNLKGEWKLYCWNFCVCWVVSFSHKPTLPSPFSSSPAPVSNKHIRVNKHKNSHNIIFIPL